MMDVDVLLATVDSATPGRNKCTTSFYDDGNDKSILDSFDTDSNNDEKVSSPLESKPILAIATSENHSVCNTLRVQDTIRIYCRAGRSDWWMHVVFFRKCHLLHIPYC